MLTSSSWIQSILPAGCHPLRHLRVSFWVSHLSSTAVKRT